MYKFVLFFLCLVPFRIHSIDTDADHQGFSIAPCEGWIREILPNFSECDNFVDYLKYVLLDKQINIDQETAFTHVATYLKTSEAVQNGSSIRIGFDPTYEKIILHQIKIIREGKYLDKISSSHIELIQEEQELDRHIFDGRKTLVILLKDIQAGDFLEYSFSRKGFNPIYKEKYFETFFLQASYPIQYSSCRIISSNKHHLNFLGHQTNVQPIYREIDGMTQEWSWEVKDVPAFDYHSAEPSWFYSSAMMQVSEFRSWKDVANWGCTLFEVPNKKLSELIALTEMWKAKHPRKRDQILQAIRFVQNEVRYFGLEMGTNSYRPQPPDEVLQRRFGDCKDKTLLLKTLLEYLNVESYPVFVSTTLREHIADWYPSPIFNHVILQINFDSHKFYIDPTINFQAGDHVGKLSTPYYGQCLVLSSATQELSKMPTPTGPWLTITNIYELNHVTDPVKLTTTRLYRGFYADDVRHNYKQKGISSISKQIRTCLSKKYGEVVELVNLDLDDNQNDNEITLKSCYELKNIWKFNKIKDSKSFSFQSDYIGNDFDFDIDPQRKVPLAIPFPYHVIENIYLIDKEGSWEKQSTRKELSNASLCFVSKKETYDESLHIQYEMFTEADHIPVHLIPEHRELMNQIKEEIFLSYKLPINSQKLVQEEKFEIRLIMIQIGCISFGFWVLFELLRYLDAKLKKSKKLFETKEM